MSFVTENPRGTCVLGGVNSVLSAIDRVCPIYHAGPGCCMQTTAGEAGQAGLKSPFFVSSVITPCSNMLEREVIFGGEQKLRDEIDGALEVIDADAFFVLAGCTSGIIGDDIANIAGDYAKRGVPIYPVTTPGFAGNSLLGYETIFQVFIDYVIEKETPKRPDLVNLLGVVPYHDPHWYGTLEEIARVLQKLGLQVNTFFTDNQGIDVVRQSAGAALNIILDPWLLKDFAQQFEELYGVKTLRFPGLPIGATDTSKLLRQIGEALSLDAALVESVIHEESAYVYRFYEGIIGAVSWKRFAVVGSAATVVGVTHFLANDYSFTPVAAIITDPMFREEDKQRIISELSTLEYAKAPNIYFEPDIYEVHNRLRENENITLIAGSTLELEVALELGAQCHVMSYPITDRLVLNKTYAGYRGSLTLVEDIFNNL